MLHCAAVCLTSGAEAQAPRDLARVVLGDEALRGPVEEELRRRGVAVVSLPAPAAEPRADREGLRRALQAFAQLELGRALAEVEAWLAAADAGRIAVGPDDLREALLLRARIELAFGRDAGPTLARARAIDPSYALDPTRHQPSLRRAWEATPVGPRVEVHFEGPPGLEVEVDGRPVQTTTRLVAGVHLVALRAPGYLPWRGVRHLDGRERVELEPDPVAALRSATELTAEVRSAAMRLGAAPLVVRREGARVVAEDAGGLGRAAVRVAPREAPDAAARHLVSALLATRRPRAPAKSPAPRRWRWVLLGAAAVAAAAGATAAAVVLRRDDGWEARYRP